MYSVVQRIALFLRHMDRGEHPDVHYMRQAAGVLKLIGEPSSAMVETGDGIFRDFDPYFSSRDVWRRMIDTELHAFEASAKELPVLPSDTRSGPQPPVD